MNTLTVFAQKAIDVLAQTHRTARVVGWGDPPEVHYQNGWKLEILKSHSTLPSEVKTRLQILRQGGVKFTHILIAHDLRKKEVKRLEIPRGVAEAVSDVLPVLASILEVLAMVLAAVVYVIARILITIILVDPVVIVVLEDGTWLEVAKWYS